MTSRLALIVALLAGCGDDSSSDAADTIIAGDADADADTGDGGSEPQCGTLRAVIRDFSIAHPDFEVTPANDEVIEGLVMPTITPGGRPVLSATPPAAGLITSAATFTDWYTDVAGQNERFEQDFALDQTSPGTYVYDRAEYFPIDGQGFGNEGNPHNYHFTTELHASFAYAGDEVFTFRGDDDVWVFVNGRLAIDIGGVHSAEERTIDFAAQAGDLGLTVGGTYAIDFFQAERHVTGSSFRIETSIDCFIVGKQ